MEQTIAKVNETALAEITACDSLDALDSVRVRYLGKKGEVTQLLKRLGSLDAEERPEAGKKINDAKLIISDAIREKKEALEESGFQKQIEEEAIDVSLPGRRPLVGGKHILSAVEEEVISVLSGMGFIPVHGRELEDEYHNFEALNIPYYHPARDDHDSIYVSNDRLLRTHTSNMQIRILEQYKPPVAVASPGKCARNDAVDATHSPVFHQIEGFFIDKNVTFADLKGCLLTFCKRLFGKESKIRLRPDFFPFVEPGAEIGVSCMKCGGSGCPTCKHTGYIEILGAGMVHPRVLEFVHIDPSEYSGFAFGMGIDRIALLKYKIPDIRLLYENNIDFLAQFN